MKKTNKNIHIQKDHTKLRLQLFYLDELVQLASESLQQLDGSLSQEE